MEKNIYYINSSEFEEEVLNSALPVIVDFYSEDCPPCEVLAPIFEKMASKYTPHIKFVKILRQANRELAIRLHVTSSPTLMFYKAGEEVGKRQTGYLNKAQVRQAIDDILGDILPPPELQTRHSDVLILGAGAAGLAAAIYASRAKLDTIILDLSVPGGQAASTYHVANYPGTPGVIRGKELIFNMRRQALSFGTHIEDLIEILDINLLEDPKTIRTEDTEYFTRAVIIASGAQPRSLAAEGAAEFKGRGIHYCATCDGAIYQDRAVAVIGGGDSALEEAVFLTKFASQVTIIHHGQLRASQTAQQEVLNNPKINVISDSEVRKVNGEGHSLKSLVIENLKTSQITEFPVDGAFVYIGTQPASEIYEGQIETDELGYIKAGEDMKTNIKGVLAAGDIRTKPIRQVVTAAADGAVAGIMAERYLHSKS